MTRVNSTPLLHVVKFSLLCKSWNGVGRETILLFPGHEKQLGFVEYFFTIRFLFGRCFACQQSNKNKIKYCNIIISRKVFFFNSES